MGEYKFKLSDDDAKNLIKNKRERSNIINDYLYHERTKRPEESFITIFFIVILVIIVIVVAGLIYIFNYMSNFL